MSEIVGMTIGHDEHGLTVTKLWTEEDWLRVHGRWAGFPAEALEVE